MANAVHAALILSVSAQNNVLGGMNSVRTSMQKSLAQMEAHASKSGAGFKAFVGKLGDAVGSRSQLKGSLDILRGGGAVAGLTIAGNLLADMTGKAKELHVAYMMGDKSAGQMADGLLRSVPVLGQIYTSGRNIREVIDGTAAEVEKINRQAALTNQFADNIRSTLADTRAIVTEVNKATASITQGTQRFRLETEGQKLARDMPFLGGVTEKVVDVRMKVDSSKAEIDRINKELEDKLTPIRQQFAKDRAPTRQALDKIVIPDVSEFKGGKNGTESQERRRDEAIREYEALDAQRRASERLEKAKIEEISASYRDQIKAIEDAARASVERFAAETGMTYEKADTLIGGAQGLNNRFRNVAKIVKPVAAEIEGQWDRLTTNNSLIRGVSKFVTGWGDALENARNNVQMIRTMELDVAETRAGLGDRAAKADAARLAVEDKYAAKRRDLNQQMSRTDITSSDRTRLKATYDELSALEEAEKAQAARQVNQDEVDRAAGRRREFATIEIDALKTRAALGNWMLDLEVRKAEIHQQYLDQEIELKRVLEDQNATLDEQARARDLLASLGRREAAEKDLAIREQMERYRSPVASVEQGGSVAAIAAAEQYLSRQAALFGNPGPTQEEKTAAAVAAGVKEALLESDGKAASAFRAAVESAAATIIDKLIAQKVKVVSAKP